MIKLYKIPVLFLLTVNLILAQSFTVEGTILERGTKEPIISANIVIKGTDFGTTSYDDGHFSILINKKVPTTLIITHIKYEGKEIVLNGKEKVEVFLEPKILSGEEVIIEGVQRHSEREVSSKIEIVELKTIEQRGIRDISEILTELEGVNINTTSYGKQTISIRGSNSNEVAVYLDGIKLNNSATGSADLAYVDLTDLEEIEVIKGGSSTLFGAGNFGGVVLLHSKKSKYNSIELNRGFGITDANDQDLSAAGTIKFGPMGLYGRYSGKSRLFDGRTLFTSIFENYGGLLSFRNQELAYRHVSHDKYIEYPSGGIVSSDELRVDRLTFFGNLFNTSGWDIQIGIKEWSWNDDFYTNLARELSDQVVQYRINKGFKFNQFSGSLQFEDEIQDYIGDQTLEDSYSQKSTRSIGSLSLHDIGLAGIVRYDVHDPVTNINLIRWEGGLRYSKSDYSQKQSVQEFSGLIEKELTEYSLKDIIPLSTYRLGILAEGNTDNKTFQIFFNQGFNNRLPTLNDRFIWADGVNQLEDYYRRLLKLYYYNGSSEDLENKLTKTKSVLDLMGNELEKEFVNTSELNGQILFKLQNDKYIEYIELGGGLFRNAYLNKIAYLSLDNNIVVPYNTNTAWLNGAEINAKISAFNDIFVLSSNMTWIQPSDQEIFPNKPSTTGSMILDIKKSWFHINISHIFNGPQYYFHGGVTIEQLQKQKNTNLTLSSNAHFWYFDATLSYTIRNIFSEDVTMLTAGSQTGDVFNYYDAHREVINLKISLSDRK
ncbi:TonB-dependent receptor plug domain-containing protein [Candidatus Neomarinimicrobiota bacterium]